MAVGGQTTVQGRRWQRRWWALKAMALVAFAAWLAAHWTHTLKSTTIATLVIAICLPAAGRTVRWHKEWRIEHPWQPRDRLGPALWHQVGAPLWRRIAAKCFPSVYWRSYNREQRKAAEAEAERQARLMGRITLNTPIIRKSGRPRGWPIVREMRREPSRYRLLAHWVWERQTYGPPSHKDHSERGGSLFEALFGERNSETAAIIEKGTTLGVVSSLGGPVPTDETAGQDGTGTGPAFSSLDPPLDPSPDPSPRCPIHRCSCRVAYRDHHCRCPDCRRWKRESRATGRGVRKAEW